MKHTRSAVPAYPVSVTVYSPFGKLEFDLPSTDLKRFKNARHEYLCRVRGLETLTDEATDFLELFADVLTQVACHQWVTNHPEEWEPEEVRQGRRVYGLGPVKR